MTLKEIHNKINNGLTITVKQYDRITEIKFISIDDEIIWTESRNGKRPVKHTGRWNFDGKYFSFESFRNHRWWTINTSENFKIV